MKNGKAELSSSCSKRHPHVHLDNSDHNEDHYSHHEQLTEQAEQWPMAQEQQDEQSKNMQPR
jgi:hypothetical protein